VIRKKQLSWVGLAVVACAASNSSGSWELRRAEKLRTEGNAEAALRLTDHQIALGNYSPTRELVALHTALLRDAGRNVEADAYQDFAARYFASERTDRVGEELARLDCSERQPGLKLIRSWAKPKKGFYEIGKIVATFEIDAQGGIGAIVMQSARDPASAWGAIDSIARARIHHRRVAALQAKHPERFPMTICLWRDFEPLRDPIPRDGTIRGGSW
jgi:hypothetical protein